MEDLEVQLKRTEDKFQKIMNEFEIQNHFIHSLIHNRDVAFTLTGEVLTFNTQLRKEVSELKDLVTAVANVIDKNAAWEQVERCRDYLEKHKTQGDDGDAEGF